MLQGWLNLLLLSEMPSYIVEVLHFSLEESGVLCMLTYLGVFLSTLFFGKLFYVLQSQHHWTVKAVRWWAMFIAFGCSSLLLILSGYISNRYAAFAILLLSQVDNNIMITLFGKK